MVLADLMGLAQTRRGLGILRAPALADAELGGQTDTVAADVSTTHRCCTSARPRPLHRTLPIPSQRPPNARTAMTKGCLCHLRWLLTISIDRVRTLR